MRSASSKSGAGSVSAQRSNGMAQVAFGDHLRGELPLTALKRQSEKTEGAERKLTFDKPAIIWARVDQASQEEHSEAARQATSRYADRNVEAVIAFGVTPDGADTVVVVNKSTPPPHK